MGFNGIFSSFGFAMSLLSSIFIGALCPLRDDARSLLLICMSFIAFLPSVIYMSYSPDIMDHLPYLIICISIIFVISSININAPFFGTLNINIYMYAIAAVILIGLLSQAAFGGLEDFNLDIEKVYDFRREAASKLPPVFGYLYSNVSTTLLPILIVLAVIKKNYPVLVISFIMTIFMFGMSHHKGVLFGPLFVTLMYVIFSNSALRKSILLIFLAIPVFSLIEISFSSADQASYMTSLFVRRVLFIPPMLDSTYIDFFSVNPKYYWSYSSLFSWALQNPYNATAPHIIGYEYFSDLDTSANTGIIGSGYSNAGFFGVVFYSAIVGFLIAIFNSYGKKIGSSIVSAIALTIVFNIVTSSDVLTAFLTHGLLLCLLLLAFYPREQLLVRYG